MWVMSPVCPQQETELVGLISLATCATCVHDMYIDSTIHDSFHNKGKVRLIYDKMA